jgi:hypothetical protein
VGGAEIAPDVFLGIAPFLRADHHHAMIAKVGEPADYRAVFGKKAVSVQFAELGEGRFQIIERERAPGMARELDALPGIEVGEDLFARLRNLLLDLCDLFLEADAQVVRLGMFSQFLQLGLQFGNRFFKIKLMFHAPSLVFPPAAGNADFCLRI